MRGMNTKIKSAAAEAATQSACEGRFPDEKPVLIAVVLLIGAARLVLVLMWVG